MFAIAAALMIQNLVYSEEFTYNGLTYNGKSYIMDTISPRNITCNLILWIPLK